MTKCVRFLDSARHFVPKWDCSFRIPTLRCAKLNSCVSFFHNFRLVHEVDYAVSKDLQDRGHAAFFA